MDSESGRLLVSRFLYTVAIAAFLSVASSDAKPKKCASGLASITARGLMLAEYDGAAWRATDAVMAAHPLGERVSRYLARKTDAGWVVDFGRLNRTGDKFLVAYEAVQVSGKFAVKSLDPARKDAGWNLAAARGVESAMKDLGETGQPYNVAVLPTTHESMYVYLYPAQVKAGVFPLGADVRYRVSPNGMSIIEKRQMHRTIIESIPERLDIKVAVGYHSHVLSDLPEDTDVLLVLLRQPRVPEIIVAGSCVFTIDTNGKISVEDHPR